MSLTETAQTFRLNPHSLVKVEAVRALTGEGYDAIFERVDGGSLLQKPLVWVFDFSSTWPDGKLRDLRFWRAELESAPGKYGHYELAWVIAKILPEKRTNFQAGEVDQLFMLTRPGRKALRTALGGTLAERTSFYPRADLVRFLEARWLKAVYTRMAKTL